MIRLSTKLKERMLAGEALASIFANGRIRIYTGPPPASADAAVTGAWLADVTTNGTPWLPNGAGGGGLLYERVGAFVIMPAGANWTLVAGASGTAGWFRMFTASQDDGDTSLNAARIDGTVGIGGSGANFILPDTVLSAGQTIPVQQFTYTIP